MICYSPYEKLKSEYLELRERAGKERIIGDRLRFTDELVETGQVFARRSKGSDHPSGHRVSGLRGPDGLTIPKLAARLNAGATSLYWHVETCGNPPRFNGARHIAVDGRTGFRHHHRRRGHGAAANARHYLPAYCRRTRAGSVLGCLVALQSKSNVAQSARPRAQSGPAGWGSLCSA